MGHDRKASPARVAAGLAVIYLVWGSTYLGMRVALETTPPFLMGGVRFALAGLLLLGWTRAAGAGRPTGRQWRNGAASGALMFLGGNGGVSWAMAAEHVPSGLAALVVAITPAWLVLMDWGSGRGPRPRATVAAGIGVGLAGVAALVGPGLLARGGAVSAAGAAALVAASACWAAGSLIARYADLPGSPSVTAGTQMVAGGAALAGAGLAAGEVAGFDTGRVSAASAGAFAYLVAAAVVALSAYAWLVVVAPPGLVGTYAFVNPVVAVFLGWLAAGERLDPAAGVAAALVVAGVALVTWPRKPAASGPPLPAGERG